MSAMTVTLGADISGLSKAMMEASAVVSAAAHKMSKVASAGISKVGHVGSEALSKGWEYSLLGMKAGLGAVLAGGVAAGAGIFESINKAAEHEQTQIAFEVLIGNAKKAEETLKSLREYANRTPFQFPEIASAARQLIAFGLSADDAVRTIARLGDVAAGVQTPIGDIAELYGKVKVGSRMTGEEIRQFTHQGIPIFAELARQFGVAESQVRKLVETGKVGFPQVEQAFIAMTSKGGKFYGMTARESLTTKGLFTTLKDVIDDVMRALGEPINIAIRPLIAETIGLVEKLKPMAGEFGEKIAQGLRFVVAAFKSGKSMDFLSAALGLGLVTAVNGLVKGLRAAVTFFFNLICDGSMWKGLSNILAGVAMGFGAALLDAFRTPIVWLQAAWDTMSDYALNKFMKIPGMDSLLGLPKNTFNKTFKQNFSYRQFYADEDLGSATKGMISKAMEMMTSGAPDLVGAIRDATEKTRQAGVGADLFDTSGLKTRLDESMQAIRDTMAGFKEVKPPLPASGAPYKYPETKDIETRFDPVVTSLGKVGGGGYATGTLDAQRENNRLTVETNRLLRDMNRSIGNLGGGTQAAFG